METTKSIPQYQTFNPVKETTTDGRNLTIQWSTAVLERAVNALGKGKRLIANPFYEKNVKLLKSDIVFVKTAHEVEEWKKCKNDLPYFIENYAKFMTPKGLRNIQLRDYQWEYLDLLLHNQLTILRAARQSGKCVTALSRIVCKRDDECCQALNKIHWSDYYTNEGVYEIPLYEILNCFETGFKWRIKYNIYKIIDKLSCQVKKAQNGFKILYFILHILSDKGDEKIIETFDIEGMLVMTDSGWQPVSKIHKTKPFVIYNIKAGRFEMDCADTHICFDENLNEKYIKDFNPGDYIYTQDGPVKVDSIVKSSISINMCDVTIDSEDHRYYTNGILSHNTTTSAMFLLWYILFNTDKNAIVLGNKGKTAKEILSKVKQVFLEVPYFLKPGVEKWNENEVVFDNGCRILTETTVAEPAIGFTLHCVLLDEFAHIAPNIQESFYMNIFPTIDAANAKLMITSTQNGPELFCRLFVAAENGENDYKPYTINWWQVPDWNPEKRCWEKRDEEWHRRKVANLGSEEAFNEQYGCEFAVATNSLIPQRILTARQREIEHFVNKEILGIDHADCFYWKPDYDPFDLRKDYVVFTTDIATGVGEDYHHVWISKLTGVADDRSPKFECVGYFRSNILDDMECCNSIAHFIDLYCNQNRHLYSFEANMNGDLWKSNFKSLAEVKYTKNFTMDNFIKYYNESLTRFKYGVYISHKSKQLGCKLFRTAYTKGNIHNTSHIFYNELKCFCDKNGNGTYAAIYGHDDTVMSLVQLPLIYDTIQFKDFLEEFISNTGADDKGQNENFYQDIQPESGRIQSPAELMQMRDFAPSSFKQLRENELTEDTLYGSFGRVGDTLYDF